LVAVGSVVIVTGFNSSGSTNTFWNATSRWDRGKASAVRNPSNLERGTARFEQQALQDVDPTRLLRFDKVFAININLFWTRRAQGELALVRQLLCDDGRLDLFYDSPTPGTYRIAGLFAEHWAEPATHSPLLLSAWGNRR
jgi:hypothetical protein